MPRPTPTYETKRKALDEAVDFLDKSASLEEKRQAIAMVKSRKAELLSAAKAVEEAYSKVAAVLIARSTTRGDIRAASHAGR